VGNQRKISRKVGKKQSRTGGWGQKQLVQRLLRKRMELKGKTRIGRGKKRRGTVIRGGSGKKVMGNLETGKSGQ